MSAAVARLDPRLSASGLALLLGALALLAPALPLTGGSGPMSTAVRACAADVDVICDLSVVADGQLVLAVPDFPPVQLAVQL